MWDEFYAKNPVQRDADNWNNWAEMHEGVNWFDTAACWSGPFIGAVNSVVITPDASTNPQFNFDPSKTYNDTPASDANPALNGINDSGSAFGTTWGGWYIGAEYSKGSPSEDYDNVDAYNKLSAPKDAAGPYQRNWKTTTGTSGGQTLTVYQPDTTLRSNAWDVDLTVTGNINWANKDLTTDLGKALTELADDCDMDCQKRGSQLTTIGILMGTAFGIIALNALFMFIGAWRYRWRVCSVYCTLVACMLQLILTIVSATMMFTKYNNVCGRSLANTFDGFRWTMNDDFMMTFNLWVGSLILMLPFVCCGMCSAYQTHM